MPVHDGENSVMCHVTPAGFNHYRAGLDREGALGYGIGDSQGGQATTGAPPRPTLNRLAASASFISIDEWSWSMTIMCTAWLRGPDRPAGLKMAEQSKPFCIQVGRMDAVDVDMARDIHAERNPIDVNQARAIKDILRTRLFTGKL